MFETLISLISATHGAGKYLSEETTNEIRNLGEEDYRSSIVVVLDYFLSQLTETNDRVSDIH